jgi:uncharacterized protein YciI
MSNQQPPVYFVLFHSPGEKWKQGVSFREQPGVREHVQYMSSFIESKKLVIGGPFLDNSGGMMVMSAESREEAEKIANADPSVQNGLLKVDVKPWMAAMRT